MFDPMALLFQLDMFLAIILSSPVVLVTIGLSILNKKLEDRRVPLSKSKQNEYLRLHVAALNKQVTKREATIQELRGIIVTHKYGVGVK